MSGIIALANFGERPIEPGLLGELVAGMAFRGPEGQGQWHDDSVGLGHVVCQLDVSETPEAQPFTLDGTVWMVADARLDDRRELRRRLQGAAQPVTSNADDTSLLLHAYLAWGTDAFRRALGDFACIIWDRRDQRLIAARDPLGVKPIYTAVWHGGLAIGNTVQTLLALPGLDQRPDDETIADFLLFDAPRSPAATPFRGLRLLPPAHCQVWSAGQRSSPRRYWSFDDLSDSDLPTSRFVSNDPARDWAEAFLGRLSEAVKDRVRSDRVAVMMSGGLDSTAVAILAHQVLSGQARPTQLGLHTVVYDPLIDDEEGHYAARVAATLAAPHRMHRFGARKLFADWDSLAPAPLLTDRTLETATRDIDQALSEDARVILTGHGGDPVQSPDVGYFMRQVRALSLVRAWRYVRRAPRRSDRRLPPLGLGALVGLRRQRKNWRHGFPTWLAPRLVRELDLETRWHDASHERLRIESDRQCQVAAGFGPEWSALFEQMDAGARGLPLAYRHPFFDLRVIAAIAHMPAVPWCVEKFLLRESMRGIMPDRVRLRPKRGLSGVPPLSPARRGSEIWRQWTRDQPELSSFVDASKVLGALEADEGNPSASTVAYRWENRRPLNLGLWMRGMGNFGVRLAPCELSVRGGADGRIAAKGLEAGIPMPAVGGVR